MKNLLLLTSIFATSLMATAQETKSVQETKSGFGIHFMGTDFYGSQTGDYLFNKQAKSPTSTDSVKKLFWTPTVRLSYWRNLGKHFDFNAGANATALTVPTSKNDLIYQNNYTSNATKSTHGFFSLDGKINYNILQRDAHIFSPYLTTGLTASLHDSTFGAYVPLGAGFNVRLAKGVFLNLESNYKTAITSKDYNHLTHSVGFVFYNFANKKAKVETPVVIEKPKVVDTDGDGIADADDKCPTVKGTLKYQGCPVPDTDGDGINDDNDKCPDTKGLAKYQGCPIPDTDGDGFNDEVDQCPQVYSQVNNGCPEPVKQDVIKKMEMAVQGIKFESGKSVLLKTSFANLDKVVSILKEQPTYQLEIGGHTDNSGDATKNMELSQKRADVCKNYIASKGIATSRMTATGHGDTMPIADNKTPAGRAQNRRTEMKLKN